MLAIHDLPVLAHPCGQSEKSIALPTQSSILSFITDSFFYVCKRIGGLIGKFIAATISLTALLIFQRMIIRQLSQRNALKLPLTHDNYKFLRQSLDQANKQILLMDNLDKFRVTKKLKLPSLLNKNFDKIATLLRIRQQTLSSAFDAMDNQSTGKPSFLKKLSQDQLWYGRIGAYDYLS